MKKRIEIKVNKKLLKKIEKYKKKNNHEDLQDSILEILKDKFFEKSFFDKIKSFFFRN